MKRLIFIIVCLFLFGCDNKTSGIDTEEVFEYKSYEFVTNHLYEKQFIKIINDIDYLNIIKSYDKDLLPDEILKLMENYDKNFFDTNNLIFIYLENVSYGTIGFDKIQMDDSINIYVEEKYISLAVEGLSGNIIFVEIPKSQCENKEVFLHLSKNSFKNLTNDNEVIVDEYVITKEDYRFKFYEDEFYMYYFKNNCPNILEIKGNKYTLQEAIKSNLITLNDLDNMNYIYKKIKKFNLEIKDDMNIDAKTYKLDNGKNMFYKFSSIFVKLGNQSISLEYALDNEIITIDDIKANMIYVTNLKDCTKVYKSKPDFSNIEFLLYDCAGIAFDYHQYDSCPIAEVQPYKYC